MMQYLILFWEFFKTGLFAIGGGLATIPFLYDMADKYPWFTREMLGDMIAISESTPGPIGVNMATYAGIRCALLDGGNLAESLLGGFIATFGLVLPSFVVIIFVYKIFEKFKSNQLVQNAFYAIRPAVTGMIASAALGMIELALLQADVLSAGGIWAAIEWKSVILFVVLLVLTNKIKLHPIVYILSAGIIGMIFKF